MWGLYQLAAECAHRFGYRYVETPAFEHTELFRRTSGETSDVVRKEMYTFEDRGERSLTLRPEATAAIVRAYLERGRGLPSPFKVFTVETMWRYGRPQSGRLREFRQFDAEVIDEAGWGADVETIALGGELLRTAAVGQVELQINSIGDGNCRPAYREELVAYLRAHRQELRDEHRDRFEENPLRILDCKDEGCKQVAAGAPKIAERLCEPCREHFQGVLEGLRAEGIEPILTDTLVRGLDYYTRTTWEWVSPRLAKGQDSVGGGGRYDGLAEVLGGPPTPGVGFAIGLERVLMLREGGEPVLNLERPETFVVGIGELSRAHTVARELRRRGVSAEVALEPRPLGTQLKMADRSNARYAVIVGSREAQAGTVTLRDLQSGDQEELELDRVVERIAIRRGTQE
jgi:histidyl-tRNA synthetase